jgi:hypothetical protein
MFGPFLICVGVDVVDESGLAWRTMAMPNDGRRERQSAMLLRCRSIRQEAMVEDISSCHAGSVGQTRDGGGGALHSFMSTIVCRATVVVLSTSSGSRLAPMVSVLSVGVICQQEITRQSPPPPSMLFCSVLSDATHGQMNAADDRRGST